MIAATEGHAEIVSLLVEAGAVVNVIDDVSFRIFVND